MKIEEFRKVIQERIECPDEWAYGVERCWKREIEILSEDIRSTIEFLLTECTADEFSWISEVIDDLAAKTQNRELIMCYKSLIEKFPKECKSYNIAENIEYAEAELNVGSCDEES